MRAYWFSLLLPLCDPQADAYNRCEGERAMKSYPTQCHTFATVVCLPLVALTAGISGSAAIAQTSMTITEWQSRAQSLDQRTTALNAEVQALLERCSGSVPIEQAPSLQYQCDRSTATLQESMKQLSADREYLLEQKRQIDAR